MVEMQAFEAKTRFGEVLDRVENGEEIVVTRRGKPVAKIVKVERPYDGRHNRQIIENIRAMGLSLRGLKIKDLIEDGRK